MCASIRRAATLSFPRRHVRRDAAYEELLLGLRPMTAAISNTHMILTNKRARQDRRVSLPVSHRLVKTSGEPRNRHYGAPCSYPFLTAVYLRRSTDVECKYEAQIHTLVIYTHPEVSRPCYSSKSTHVTSPPTSTPATISPTSPLSTSRRMTTTRWSSCSPTARRSPASLNEKWRGPRPPAGAFCRRVSSPVSPMENVTRVSEGTSSSCGSAGFGIV